MRQIFWIASANEGILWATYSKDLHTLPSQSSFSFGYNSPCEIQSDSGIKDYGQLSGKIFHEFERWRFGYVRPILKNGDHLFRFSNKRYEGMKNVNMEYIPSDRKDVKAEAKEMIKIYYPEKVLQYLDDQDERKEDIGVKYYNMKQAMPELFNHSNYDDVIST